VLDLFVIRLICVLGTGLLLFAGASAFAAEELFDPTRPPLYMEQPVFDSADPDGLVLSAILISEERQIAVINGQPVRKGDRVAGSRVVAIRPWGVTLDGVDGQPLELRLSRRTVKSAGPPPEEP
jgi:hypothetical protein